MKIRREACAMATMVRIGSCSLLTEEFFGLKFPAHSK
jgi:hypothetical protein